MKSTFLHHQDTARCLWGPQHPGGWVEPLGNRAGLCGEGGGRSGGQRWSAPLGAAGGGEASIHQKRHTYLEGPVGAGRDLGFGGSEGNVAHIPPPTQPGGPAEALHLVLHLSRLPLLTGVLGGVGGGARRKRQAGWGGTLEERISEVTGCPPSTQPGAACGGPKPDTARTEALFCFCYWVLFHLPVVSYTYSLIYVNLLSLCGILCYCCYFIFSATLHSLQDLGSPARGQA